MNSNSLSITDCVYSLKTEYRELKTVDYVSEYSCIWHVKTYYDENSQLYEFILTRSEVKINNHEPEQLMDRIMYETGNSLHPIRLTVSKKMTIVQIINYDEITERWKQTTEKCGKEYPCDVINRYIAYAAVNSSSPRSLLRSLYNDSFINLYFRDIQSLPKNEGERERIEWNNFPLKEMKSTYYCKINKADKNRYRLDGLLMPILSGQEGVANIDYTFDMQGKPELITGLFTATNDSKPYQKKIDITEICNKELTTYQERQ